jgi:hypothetical protein
MCYSACGCSRIVCDVVFTSEAECDKILCKNLHGMSCNDYVTLWEKTLMMTSLTETCSFTWRTQELRKWRVNSDVRIYGRVVARAESQEFDLKVQIFGQANGFCVIQSRCNTLISVKQFLVNKHIHCLIICYKKGKAVPLHAMEALGGRGGIAPTHSRPRH